MYCTTTNNIHLTKNDILTDTESGENVIKILSIKHV